MLSQTTDGGCCSKNLFARQLALSFAVEVAAADTDGHPTASRLHPTPAFNKKFIGTLSATNSSGFTNSLSVHLKRIRKWVTIFWKLFVLYYKYLTMNRRMPQSAPSELGSRWKFHLRLEYTPPCPWRGANHPNP